jgi:hypothetical protein
MLGNLSEKMEKSWGISQKTGLRLVDCYATSETPQIKNYGSAC